MHLAILLGKLYHLTWGSRLESTHQSSLLMLDRIGNRFTIGNQLLAQICQLRNALHAVWILWIWAWRVPVMSFTSLMTTWVWVPIRIAIYKLSLNWQKSMETTWWQFAQSNPTTLGQKMKKVFLIKSRRPSRLPCRATLQWLCSKPISLSDLKAIWSTFWLNVLW